MDSNTSSRSVEGFSASFPPLSPTPKKCLTHSRHSNIYKVSFDKRSLPGKSISSELKGPKSYKKK